MLARMKMGVWMSVSGKGRGSLVFFFRLVGTPWEHCSDIGPKHGVPLSLSGGSIRGTHSGQDWRKDYVAPLYDQEYRMNE